MTDTSLLGRWRGLSRLQRWSVIVCLGVLFYTVFGFFILPRIIRHQLEKNVSELLHRQTAVREVKINPYSLQASIHGFTVQELSGEASFVSFETLQLNLQTSSLFKRALVIESVSLEKPFFRLVLNEDQSFNFSDLFPAESAEDEKEKTGKGFSFSINNIDISGGNIEIDDRMQGAEHHVADLHLALPFISNIASDVEIFVKPAFAAVINGTELGMAGESKPFVDSRQTEFDIKFTGIDLTRYLAYLPKNVNVDIQRGLLDLDLALSFMQHEDGAPALNISGTVGLREVEVFDADQQPLLSLPELVVDIDRAHIIRKEFHLRGIKIHRPEIHVTLLQDGGLNLTELMSSPEKKEAGADADSALRLDVKEMVIEGAKVIFADLSVAGEFQTTLQPLDLTVHGFSTEPGVSADYALTFAGEKEEKVTSTGAFSIDPLQVSAELNLENVDVGKYRPYYENALQAGLEVKNVHVAADLDFSAPEDIFLLSDIAVDLDEVRLRGPEAEEDEIVVPAFSISGASVDVKKKRVVVGGCASRGGRLLLMRRGDGSLNVQDFTAAASAPVEAESGRPAASQDAWTFLVNGLTFTDYSLSFADHVPGQPAFFEVDQLALTADNLGSDQDVQGDVALAFRINQSGMVDVKGTAGFAPLSLQLDLDVQDVGFQAIQSYLSEKLNIIIGDGLGGVTGTLSYASRQDDSALHFQGKVVSRRFACLDSRNSENLLSWDTFNAANLDVSTNPMQVSVEDLSLDGLHVFVSVDPQGAINLGTLAKKGEEAESVARETDSGEALSVEINRVNIQGGRADFADSSVAPSFNSRLEDITGQISGLNSSKDGAADIDISARLDGHSPLKITGSIQPWQDFFTDISVDLNDIDLSPMSPYSLKFIGYPLAKGKLNLNLHYLIEGKKLTSENKAFVNQITLGDFVDSETVSKMPVQLAVSLLKNRAGEIHLNIPVSGELDDPEFSVAGVVVKVLFNLLVKAATSPFALLGSIFPDGEEVQFVSYEAGSSIVVEEDREKLASLAKALYDRPALNVDLSGFVDPEEDRKTLRQMHFDRLLKAQKIEDMVKKSKAVIGIDDVEIAAEEYEIYLKKAYKAAEFDRPKNFLGLLKKQTREEMERLIFENIRITDDDLRQLAVSRAGAVKDILVREGPVETERIFLIEPQMDLEDGEDMPGMRVEMVLK